MLDLEQIGYFLYMEQCEKEQQEKEEQERRRQVKEDNKD